MSDGLYNKYHVKKIDDIHGKHDECFFFVLDLDHDPYAVYAMLAYAERCKKEYPALSADLMVKLNKGCMHTIVYIDSQSSADAQISRCHNCEKRLIRDSWNTPWREL